MEKVVLQASARLNGKTSVDETQIKREYWMGKSIFMIVKDLIGNEKMNELKDLRFKALQGAYKDAGLEFKLPPPQSNTPRPQSGNSGERKQYPARANLAQIEPEPLLEEEVVEEDETTDSYNQDLFNELTEILEEDEPYNDFHSYMAKVIHLDNP